MKRLSAMDTTYLLGESSETPMHFGGLCLLTIPEGEDEDAFIRRQLDVLRSPQEWRPPFGHRLEMGRLGAAGPTYWVPDERFDVDHHVRRSALPHPGGMRELFTLVARLHESLLDRRRPLWEMEVIEGLKDRQLALYWKMHHAAIDGVSGLRLALDMVSPDPDERRDYSPFSRRAHELAKAKRDRSRSEPATKGDLEGVAALLRESFGSTTDLVESLAVYARAWWRDEEEALTTAWTPAPKTVFNSNITGARRFVAQSYSLPRVRAVGKALGGTINDVVLAMCGGAMRRYLMARGELPDHPMTAMAPVSLRAEGQRKVGNAVGALIANLGTHLSDPGARFEAVTASMNAGKALLRGMSAKAVELFTLVTLTPAWFVGVLGLGDRFPPYSTVISNIPGPRERRYWNGARLDGLYPVGNVNHGAALNITLLSNDDQLDFGIVACPERVPHAQRLIDDLQEALEELERAAGL